MRTHAFLFKPLAAFSTTKLDILLARETPLANISLGYNAPNVAVTTKHLTMRHIAVEKL